MPKCSSRCHACGQPVRLTDTICPHCGVRLTIICPGCGRETFIQSNCRRCGKSLFVVCPSAACGRIQLISPDGACRTCGATIST